MANVKFIEGLGDEGIYQHYAVERLVLQAGATAKSAIFIDWLTGDKIRIVGTNLTFQSNDPTGGTITKFSYLDANNNPYLIESDARIDAFQWKVISGSNGEDFAGMFKYSLRNDDVVVGTALPDILQSFNGNDIVNGGKGADDIMGGEGNDKLTGGLGFDEFFIRDKSARDVITDFDANGGGVLQDHLYIQRDDPFEITKSGDNVVITFEEGGRVTLLNVKLRHFDEADYSL
ncbi:hypothetical protein IHQ71_26940 [Rhizobium sp. TH2]|uniref:hypothetical protein n=1 Tax=Rhizobium sp. TH2 TaxID=2775403 RepID=UPI00215733D3|nr:hypothetical protein [Rhizobium sp. TH2]UVC08721.1 hypothetical protein IHQ71_26940 [Rhizobium sp. TH2]